MRFRKLRIAWSVGCAIACALLVVLWIRSYWWRDTMGGAYFVVDSINGHVIFYDSAGINKPNLPILTLQTVPHGDWTLPPGFVRSEVPHWALVLSAGVLAGAVWIPTRFSLRTLLVATTLVAIVLGLIVWLR